MKVHVVSATRRTREAFWAEGALGLSLRRFADDVRLVPWIAYENTHGLPEVYNQVITAGNADGAVVFVHDDVWLDDHFFVQRVLEGLEVFDVLGLAGNRRRVPGQPGWAFVDADLRWDDRANLSGRVAHGRHALGRPGDFGPVPAACELLDGVLLAARVDTLLRADCRFDPRFRFHFYDLDFCRTARARRLRLGTWPIGVTHQSGGAFGSDAWRQGYRDYLEKWRD
ncbi:MAG: hypothetical protein AB7P21_31000 [Lautropia sp.]